MSDNIAQDTDPEKVYKRTAADARLKRKSILRQKAISKHNGTNKSTPNMCVRMDSPSRTRNCKGKMPLSDISSNILNANIQSEKVGGGSQLLKTQPTSLNFRHQKRRILNNLSCVRDNLLDRLEDTCPTFDEQRSTNQIFIEDDLFNDGVHMSEDDETNEMDIVDTGYNDIGDPIYICHYCGAYMWYQERKKKNYNTNNPKFYLCCGDGKIQLPLLRRPPAVLHRLLYDKDSADSKHFQKHIRLYNMMFAFTSPGANLHTTLNNGKGPPIIRIQGQLCHLIGSLLPMPGKPPKFAQLYIYDTEHEIDNRLKGIRAESYLHPHLVSDIKIMLDEYNVFAKSFRMAKERFNSTNTMNVRLQLIFERKTDGRIYNLPTVSEVATLVPGDVDIAANRDIILETQSGKLKRINELHASYLALQYPLLFPYGEDGYRNDVPHRQQNNQQDTKRNKVTIREFFSFRLQSRKDEAQTLLRSRRLFQQFIVDGYTMMESERLFYIRTHQKKLRVEKYSSLHSCHDLDQSQSANVGKRVVLPSTFVGGRRYMDQLYFDGMAICAQLGFPDLFITFTCNPNWPEIQRLLKPMNLTAQDRPDIVSRVFKLKLDNLLTDFKKNQIFGRVVAYIYTIEFQKRGLPHAHILLFLHSSNKYPSVEDIDRIISAEIPDQHEEPILYDCVKNHMLHGPCGLANKSSPCMKDGQCSRFFPKKFQPLTIVDQEGYPVYRRRNNGKFIEKNGVFLDNHHVVPYNPKLLLRYKAHINIEWCNQSTSIKYLFKYINKGYDRITASLEPEEGERQTQSKDIDEVTHYLDCRYISACEACWRIFSFQIHGRIPAVERLYFHLPNEQFVLFEDDDDLDLVLSKPTMKESMFTAWFEANKTFNEGKDLTYVAFVTKFVYIAKTRSWQPRKQGYTIGRLNWVPPSTGELYYLRMMLSVIKGPCCYEDIRTVNGIQYPTFREACFAMGFLHDDRECVQAIKEAFNWGSGFYLRKLFVIMLLSNSINKPEHVWEQTCNYLVDGILHDQRLKSKIPDLHMEDKELQNLALIHIEELLQSNRRSLKDYPSMPYPANIIKPQFINKLIYEEINYDAQQLKDELITLSASLTDEQADIFQQIMTAVSDQHGQIFFVYGYGGTGKTFVWRTLAAALRSRGDIVLTVASSGIASLLLPGGGTAYSKFSIPVPTLPNSTCNIHQGSELAELLKVTNLIIWDEAPMAHKFCFEALDKTLRDIMSSMDAGERPFGGKVVVFGGDFRQILPVIPKGSRSDIINSTINASYLWEHCKVVRLTKNMRLQSTGDPKEVVAMNKFSQWLLCVGDGKLSEPNDGYAEIEIPEDLLIKEFTDPIEAIVQVTYPDLLQQHDNTDFLKSRAILASTIDTVDKINEYVLSLLPGDEKQYLSSDSVDMSEALHSQPLHSITPEFLHSLRTSGIPNHKIVLKPGTPVMLLRNLDLDQAEGLCNGTRLIVTRLADHIIQARIISGKNIGNLVYIPRMSLTPSQSPWPFKLVRRQFPLIVSYVMTINKSQGQSSQSVGLYLPKPVFSHGQLYVAFSRVQRKEGLKILIHDNEGKPINKTTNVVFKEVFENLWSVIS